MRIDRNARPSRLTAADFDRQQRAVERWEREQAAFRRRERLSAIAVWVALGIGTLVFVQASGLLGLALGGVL